MNLVNHAGHVWLSDPPPGGWVCGYRDPSRPDGVCGMPVESEPCAEHAPRTSVTWTDVHEAVMTATVVPIIVDMQTGGARGFTDAEQAALARAVADQLVPGGAS